MVRILIIDPYDDFAVLLAEILENADIEARRISRVEHAARFREWQPVVLLVATELLTGSASIGILRATLPSVHHVVGMVNDAYANTDDLGCDRIVLKPFYVSALLEHINEQLDTHTLT